MAAVTTDDVSASTGPAVRLAGLACWVAGVLGAASGVFLAVYPAEGSDDTWRYPLSADGFAAIQAWFGIQHVGLLLGVLALLGRGAFRGSRAGRLGVWAATAGLAILAVTELLAITARHADLDEYAYLNGLYGVSSTLAGAGLVAAGVAVRRAGVWLGWRSWIVLVTGVWVFVPMFPAMAAGFLPARLGITGWMLTFAALGWALWREEDTR